jgi:hypothetical protein
VVLDRAIDGSSVASVITVCVCVSGVVKISKKGILSVGLSVESFGLTKSDLWVPEDHKFIAAQCMRFTL